jgi:serine/threonine protein kinase
MDVKYEIVSELGKGQFGRVVRVKSSLTDSFYAAKVSKGRNKLTLTYEAQIHSRLTHPNILQFVTSFECLNKDPVTITPLPSGEPGDMGVMVLELCSKETLQVYTLVHKRPSMPQISAWGSDIASGLLYLKEQGIVHRDIKPDNILICDDGVKIGDFGMAALEEDLVSIAGSMQRPSGTPYYMPVEAFTNIYGYFTDVFALGVILYQLYTGLRPYEARTQDQLVKTLKTREAVFKFPSQTKVERNQDLEALILRMLDKNQELRPQIEEIVHHPFFHQSPLDVTVMEESLDDIEIPDVMTFEVFRDLKAEFGDGDRHQFYLYLANKKSTESPMSMRAFTEMWNRL